MKLQSFFNYAAITVSILVIMGCAEPSEPRIEYIDRPIEIYKPVPCVVTLPPPPLEANTTAETSLNIKKWAILTLEAIKACSGN